MSGPFGRWDAITAAQEAAAAQDEVKRILRAAKREGLIPPGHDHDPGPQPEGSQLPASTPREVVPLRPRGEPWEAGEPQWTENGYGRYLSRPYQGGPGREGRWERLDPPTVDLRRGEYLALKAIRASGTRGLHGLRRLIRGDDE